MDALAFTHPELRRRYELLVARCWARSWDVGITSSTRSEAQQREWYRLWQAGEWPALVADPDRIYCKAPDELGDWIATGSMHMVQADGWSHALDLWWLGPSPDEFKAEAYQCGLHPVEPTENWHYQFWDASRIVFNCYDQGDEMDQAQFSAFQSRALGRPGNGIGCTRVNPGDNVTVEVMLIDGNWYAYADVVEFLHRKLYPPPVSTV